MAQSVDTKIVELKFNNDNFADKVDSTLTKLEQLNKDIKEVGLSDALKNLTRDAKQVDLSGVTRSVEETTKGFSKMEVFAVTAMANISNSVVNLGKRMVKSLINPLTQGVIQGGLSRARNIEQATFSFEGQKIGKSKGHETLSYYHEVMEAVLGTSYSYDVAARAASQLAASNVGVEKSTRKLADGTKIETKVLNEGMTKALLGIAGVASMTGRSFDDVSRIFTKVAGNNRVYAQDLQSIASMGLNAAAVLGQQMGKTEEEIYDMVKKGEIHFAEFSKAMSDAFGQHAKDSTLQFQGALDDVNAALARIGADFYGPALKAGRDILNSVTPLVDVIHTKLNPALEGSSDIMGSASKKLSQYLDMLSYIIQRYPNGRGHSADWIQEHMNAWTNIADLYKRGNLKEAVKTLYGTSSKWKGMDNKGINGFKMLADYLNVVGDKDTLGKYLNKTEDQIDEIVKKGKIGTKDLRQVINGMIDDGTIGFNEFYKSFKDLWGKSNKLMNISGISKTFDKFILKIIRADEPSKRFTDNVATLFTIFDGAKSLIGSFTQIFEGLGSIFLTIAKHLAPLGHLFVDSAKELANFVIYVADAIATSEHFSSAIDSVVSILVKIFEVLHLDKLAITALGGITKAFDFLASAVERVQAGIAKVFEVVSTWFNKIVDKIYNMITDVNALRDIFETFKKVGLVVALINLVSYITKPAQLFDALSKSIDNVAGSFSGMLKNFGEVFKSIAGLAGKIGKAIDEVTNTLKRMQELIVATAIFEIALAIAVLAGALYLLSKVDVKSSAVALASFAGVAYTAMQALNTMKTVTKKIKIWEKSVDTIKGVGFAMIEFAAALAIMAGAVYMLAKIDPVSLASATAAVEALMWTLIAMAKMLSFEGTKSTGIKALWSGQKQTKGLIKGLFGLVALAAAVRIVAKAMVDVASIDDPDRLVESWAVIELLMWSMAGIAKLLSSDKTTSMTKGVAALLGMAIAIKLLTKPIIELASIDATSMWNAVGAVGGLILALSIMTTMMSGAEKMVSIGVGLILVAAAVKILQDVIVAFAMLDPESLVAGVLGVVGLVFSLMITLQMLDAKGAIAKAVALVLIAYMLKELQDVVMTFGNNFDAAMKGLLGIGAALTGLLFAIYAFNAVPLGGILKLFGSLMLGAVVVATFGAAIAVFSIGVGMFGISLTIMANGVEAASAVAGPFIAIMVGFAIAIGLLSSIGLPAVGVILALGLAFLMLGGGMMLIGTGMEHLATSIKLLEEMKGQLGNLSWKITMFVKDLTKLTDNAEDVGESFKTISKPLASMSKSVTSLSENIDKLTAAYDTLKTDTVGCIETLATSLTTISELNEESFSSATESVKGFIEGLASVSQDTSTVSQAAADISASLEEIKASVSEVMETLSLFQQRVAVFSSVGNSLASIAEPITTLNNLRGDLAGLADDIIAFVESMKSMKENSAVVDEGAIAISDSLKQVGQAATVASNNFSSFTKSMADIMSAIGKSLTDIAKGAADLAKNQKGISKAGKAIQNFYGKLESVNASADTIAKGTKTVANAVKKLGEAAKNSVDGKAMVASGQKIVDNFVKGINAKGDSVSNKMVKIVDSADAKVRKRRSAFYSTGSYLIQGMINGISAQQYSLELEVQKLEAKAERAVRAKAKIKSPSRVWMKIGGYLGQGLAIGIKNSGTDVKHASIGLASVSEDAVASAIASISHAIEDGWDTDPVIRPVVDLSDINRSAGLVNSAFNKTVGLSARGTNLAGSINTIQNGGRSGLNSTLSNLGDKLGQVTETMNSRQMTNYITVDGAEDPLIFADKLVRGLKLNARTM